MTTIYTNGTEAHAAEAEPAHPLDKDKTFVDLGRMADYANLVTELTGTPREFNELIGLTALAAVLHNAKLQLGFTGINGLRPNIYGCIVAPSSVYHKSTALRKVHEILDYPRLHNCARLPSQFTEEGLVAKLVKEPAGLVVRDEIGMLFASYRKRYLETVTQMLTQVYDGDTFDKALSQAESIVINPYVNIIGATTPSRFYGSVREIDWQDGFLVRWLFVVPEAEPDFDYTPPMWTVEHADRTNRLQRWLLEINDKPSTTFRFERTEDYTEAFEKWRVAGLREAYESEQGERVLSIVTRYSVYALKFAMLLSVAREKPWGVITTDCLIDGMRLADNYKRNVYRLLTEQGERRVDGAKVHRVFNIIHGWMQFAEQAGRSRPTRRMVGQYAKVTATVRDEAIDELLQLGAIDEIKKGRTTELIALTDALPVSKRR